MLTKVSVPADKWHAYKQPDAKIEAGEYFVYTAPRVPDFERRKKVLELKAVQDEKGRFRWLAPFEPWVQRVVTGKMDMVPSESVPPDWSVIGIEPDKLRTWQRDCVTEAWTYLAHGLDYKKGWVASIGAGKTLAGLCLMQMFEPDKCLVLADRYLHETWATQAKEWGFTVPTCSTYESAKKHIDRGVQCLILDEVLKVKNPNAQRSKYVAEIAGKTILAVGFTGIAVAGERCQDFRWLRAVAQGSVPSTNLAWQFAFGLDTELKEVGANKAYITTRYNEDAVTAFVSPFIRTIDKSEVLAELPEIQFNYVEVDTPSQYKLIKAGGATTSGVHKKLAQTLQCTDGFIYSDDETPVRVSSPKIQAVHDFVENLGEPVMVISAWSEAINILKETLEGYDPAIIQGGSDFEKEITRFKEGETSVMILNAGFSKGMNLQGVCRTILFLSVSTRPDDYEQMLGRVHRPGQKLGVNIIFISCKGTLDRRRIELVQKHKEYSTEVVERLLMEELNDAHSEKTLVGH